MKRKRYSEERIISILSVSRSKPHRKETAIGGLQDVG